MPSRTVRARIAAPSVVLSAAPEWPGLSDTQGTQPDPQALAAFQAGITHASLTDARGNELTWAGGNAPGEYGPLHGHDLQPEFVGGDQAAEAFHHRTKRYESGATGDAWVTEYDPEQTSSVQEAMVGGGLLRDQQGAPLTGSFGYVISPNDGSPQPGGRREGPEGRDRQSGAGADRGAGPAAGLPGRAALPEDGVQRLPAGQQQRPLHGLRPGSLSRATSFRPTPIRQPGAGPVGFRGSPAPAQEPTIARRPSATTRPPPHREAWVRVSGLVSGGRVPG